MQNTEWVAKTLELMSAEQISDEKFNEAMIGLEGTLKSKGIELDVT